MAWLGLVTFVAVPELFFAFGGAGFSTKPSFQLLLFPFSSTAVSCWMELLGGRTALMVTLVHVVSSVPDRA